MAELLGAGMLFDSPNAMAQVRVRLSVWVCGCVAMCAVVWLCI